MTALCLSTSAALGTYPVLVTAVALLTVCLVWALHLRSLRRCERDLLGLVDQRTRQWQSEVHAHARLRQQVTALSVMADRLLVEAVESAGAWSQNDGPDRPAGDTDGGDGTDVPGRPPQSSIRVLVVEERVDWRGTLEALFDWLGVASSFADSAWAGAVAAGEARGQGTPDHCAGRPGGGTRDRRRRGVARLAGPGPVRPAVERRRAGTGPRRETVMDAGNRLVDVPALMDRLEGDRVLLKELVDLYVEDEPSQLAEIARAIEARDGEALRRAAHTLKGAVANFCAPSAQAAVLALETVGRTGALDEAPAALARVTGLLARVRAELAELTRKG